MPEDCTLPSDTNIQIMGLHVETLLLLACWPVRRKKNYEYFYDNDIIITSLIHIIAKHKWRKEEYSPLLPVSNEYRHVRWLYFIMIPCYFDKPIRVKNRSAETNNKLHHVEKSYNFKLCERLMILIQSGEMIHFM